MLASVSRNITGHGCVCVRCFRRRKCNIGSRQRPVAERAERLVQSRQSRDQAQLQLVRESERQLGRAGVRQGVLTKRRV